MHPGHIIKYIDVHGATRTLKCIERVDGLVNWRKGHPYSQASRYQCEDGHVIQIPDDAWKLVQVLSETRPKQAKMLTCKSEPT